MRYKCNGIFDFSTLRYIQMRRHCRFRRVWKSGIHIYESCRSGEEGFVKRPCQSCPAGSDRSINEELVHWLTHSEGSQYFGDRGRTRSLGKDNPWKRDNNVLDHIRHNGVYDSEGYDARPTNFRAQRGSGEHRRGINRGYYRYVFGNIVTLLKPQAFFVRHTNIQ